MRSKSQRHLLPRRQARRRVFPPAPSFSPTTTLESWRRFIHADPSEFALLPQDRWQALGERERRDYDDARRGRGPEEREDQSGGGEDRGEQERVHIERVREKDGEDTPERAARVEDRQLRPDM